MGGRASAKLLPDLYGRLHPETIVTHTFPLSQGPEAYALFNSRADGVSKVVLDPTR